jgi:1,2-diacylglycerol 3-alpha-glucosyltransferase
VLEAFARVRGEAPRLIINAQLPRRDELLAEAARRDPRVEVVTEDQAVAEHLRLFASCDICLAPSRWEGLGLPLYEATAFGMPIITNDAPPMNEIVEHELNGLLVRSFPAGHAKSGIPAYDPDPDELAAAIERLVDPDLRARLADGARRVLERRGWERTVSEIGKLLEKLSRARAAD